MTRHLIPFEDQVALLAAAGDALTAEIARVRKTVDVPMDWRLDRSCAFFYNPAGMTQGEINSYDAERKDVVAALIDDNRVIQAVAQLDFEERQKLQVKPGQALRTAAECRARVKAIYLSLLP